MRQAACKNYDTNIFYPAPGDIDNLRLAKSICKECVSRHECLDYALSTSERFGIWGGKSARERMLILRAQRLLNRNTDFDDPRQIDTPPPSE